MREITFRGKSKYSGDIVYGDLIHDEHNKLYIGCIVRNEFLKEEVEPESVAQLVGYDEDGNEVYEGDTINYLSNEKVKVRLSGETETCSYLGIAGDKFYDCKLKK